MKKNFIAFLIVTLSLLSLAFCVIAESESQEKEDMKAIFEKKYKNWKQFMNSSQSMVLSDTTGTSTPYFEEIIKLGIPALPYIVEKMEKDSTLWIAVRKITKRCFREDERSKERGNIANLYLIWWREGRKQTPQLFDKFYSEWQFSKKQGKEKEAKEKYQRIKDLGIVALPYIVKKVEQGDMDLIAVISELTDGAIKEASKPSECVDWWNKNKDKWTIPTDSE